MLGRGDSFVARAVLSLGPTRAIAKHTGFRCFFVGWLIMLGRGDSFVARAVLSLGRSRAIAKHTRLRSFMWVGSTGWEEVILSLQELCFHSVEAALLPNTLVSEVFVGWLIRLGRGASRSMQKLCFHLVEAALLPKTLASGVVFVGWLIMLGRGDSLSLQELCFH